MKKLTIQLILSLLILAIGFGMYSKTSFVLEKEYAQYIYECNECQAKLYLKAPTTETGTYICTAGCGQFLKQPQLTLVASPADYKLENALCMIASGLTLGGACLSLISVTGFLLGIYEIITTGIYNRKHNYSAIK